MKRSLFAELKRRHVYRVAAVYVVVGWLLLEVATQLFPFFRIPNWSIRFLVFIAIAGFPIALVLAWAFELTPEGVRRTEPADSPEARPREQQRQVGRTLDLMVIGVLVVAVALLAWRVWGTHAGAPATNKTAMQSTAPAKTAATEHRHNPAESAIPGASGKAVSSNSIAVLPFENLSADKNNKYFADGMQDLILTKLADIGELKVISRTSTAKYASRPDDLKTIAEQLGVANVLEGSVQKAGSSVLINVQLINARTDEHIWAQAYTRTLDNVFGVEGEVAQKIADALKAKLSPEETKRLATALSASPAANDLFLRAEYYSNRGQADYDTAAWRQAIPLYRQALAKAPDFALALAELSQTESLLAFFGGGGEDVSRLNADACTQAEQALKMAPELPEGHLAIGYCNYYGKGDYGAALKAFSEALRIRPNDAGALAARGYVLRRQGEFDAAIEALRQAQTHDPRNSVVAAELGSTYRMASRYAQAEQAYQRALAIDPGNLVAKHSFANAILYDSGDVERALAEAQGDDPRLRVLRAQLLTYQRKYREALTLLEGIPDTSDRFFIYAEPKLLRQANLYRFAGDSAKARSFYMQALPRAHAQVKALADSPIELAFALAYLAEAEFGVGHSAAGLAAVAKSEAIVERSHDRTDGPHVLMLDAAASAQAERADKAVRILSKALATPGIGQYYSPAMLWIDPAWDPIRKSSGFRALLKKYARNRPAVVPDETGQSARAGTGKS